MGSWEPSQGEGRGRVRPRRAVGRILAALQPLRGRRGPHPSHPSGLAGRQHLHTPTSASAQSCRGRQLVRQRWSSRQRRENSAFLLSQPPCTAVDGCFYPFLAPGTLCSPQPQHGTGTTRTSSPTPQPWGPQNTASPHHLHPPPLQRGPPQPHGTSGEIRASGWDKRAGKLFPINPPFPSCRWLPAPAGCGARQCSHLCVDGNPPLACFKANRFFSSGTIYYGHKLLSCHLLLLLIFFLRGDRRDLGLARAAGIRHGPPCPTGGGGFCKPADLGSGIWGLGTLNDASVGGIMWAGAAGFAHCRHCPVLPDS